MKSAGQRALIAFRQNRVDHSALLHQMSESRRRRRPLPPAAPTAHRGCSHRYPAARSSALHPSVLDATAPPRRPQLTRAETPSPRPVVAAPQTRHRPPSPLTSEHAQSSRSTCMTPPLLKHTTPAPTSPLSAPLFRKPQNRAATAISASKLDSNTVLHHSLIHHTTSSSDHPQTHFASPPSLCDTLPSPPPSSPPRRRSTPWTARVKPSLC